MAGPASELVAGLAAEQVTRPGDAEPLAAGLGEVELLAAGLGEVELLAAGLGEAELLAALGEVDRPMAGLVVGLVVALVAPLVARLAVVVAALLAARLAVGLMALLVAGAVVRHVLGASVVGSGARPAVEGAAGAVAAVPQALASSAQTASEIATVPRTPRSRVVMVAMMWRPSPAGPRPGAITKSYAFGNDLPKIDITAQLAACVVS
ncbi:hypothetical protein [Nonomuraea jabiensis]|uniref:hypothetical protein n=1 Tax=Nonomuraea jabiensis TaxID=882448 RepID=UPI003D754ECF